jgi:hypothetical protein
VSGFAIGSELTVNIIVIGLFTDSERLIVDLTGDRQSDWTASTCIELLLIRVRVKLALAR